MINRTQHKLVLSNEVWARTRERSILESKTASDICEYVLRHYLKLSDADRPPIVLTQTSESGQPRTVYIDKIIWAEAMGLKVVEKRPISAILEQQLRAYLGLEF